jgi:hypothetical protein
VCVQCSRLATLSLSSNLHPNQSNHNQNRLDPTQPTSQSPPDVLYYYERDGTPENVPVGQLVEHMPILMAAATEVSSLTDVDYYVDPDVLQLLLDGYDFQVEKFEALIASSEARLARAGQLLRSKIEALLKLTPPACPDGSKPVTCPTDLCVGPGAPACGDTQQCVTPACGAAACKAAACVSLVVPPTPLDAAAALKTLRRWLELLGTGRTAELKPAALALGDVALRVYRVRDYLTSLNLQSIPLSDMGGFGVLRYNRWVGCCVCMCVRCGGGGGA